MNFNPELDELVVYEAGKPIELVVREFGISPSEIIKLGSNENPYGCSPKVSAAIAQNAKMASYYPDDSMFELKEGLAQKYHLAPSNIIIGSGSDQVIEFCIHAKCAKGNSRVLMAKTTFAMYEIYAKQVGAEIIKTPSHSHEILEFKQLYAQYQPDIVFLCLPNNPLGECLDKSDVFEFISQTHPDTLVIIDGAYQEFACFKDKSKAIAPKELLERFENVIYLGTFSKAYGLGGMRVGYGVAPEGIIKALHKVRPPFNIGVLSLLGAVEALKDEDFVQACIQNNAKEMIRYEGFAQKHNIAFIPSWTNFITYILNDTNPSTQISHWLLQRGVIVRDLRSYGINAVRITIGTQEQNTRVLALLEEFLQQKCNTF
ncbi:histidinol-phosphate transaminase [Helicobacter sp. 12S02634-8]|uniref:histidinol-phosphate transaminase n=1 Tax=Helicobacter sp. 12S02634-8 TaxID=1476199 RepID=UPI000BA5E519|nr:histidinol-phosphate transaminase [Helicobacter sp. 12S02634-8]PAF47327.1 histidinol-phosphate transaminase [Helicobacter sp. 12S02634-8]